MQTRLESATESALCGGMLMALLWGIGVSVRGLVLGPQEVSWSGWMIQLLAGVACGLILPPAMVRGTAWVRSRIDASRQRVAKTT